MKNRLAGAGYHHEFDLYIFIKVESHEFYQQSSCTTNLYHPFIQVADIPQSHCSMTWQHQKAIEIRVSATGRNFFKSYKSKADRHNFQIQFKFKGKEIQINITTVIQTTIQYAQIFVNVQSHQVNLKKFKDIHSNFRRSKIYSRSWLLGKTGSLTHKRKICSTHIKRSYT